MLETFKIRLKSVLPSQLKALLRRPSTKITTARKDSNVWLRHHVSSIYGRVLSVGSGLDDCDGEGKRYRDYFTNCSSYVTSDIKPGLGVDEVIDIRSMPQVENSSFDCIYCSGVLEHVDDYISGFNEITRILKSGGVLLLGLPFRQAIHMAPNDYWRFTEYGIRYMLTEGYQILDLSAIDNSMPGFPATYWVKATKK
jgi:SAM-dependent methyltransferase